MVRASQSIFRTAAVLVLSVSGSQMLFAHATKSSCEKRGDVGQWRCPGTSDMINCDYVCDGYDPADCSEDGADEDANFCAVWNGDGADGDDMMTGGDDIYGGGGGGGVCEKKGDVGEWQCPGEDKKINCDYVCDDYEPADCDEGSDEDAGFCDAWGKDNGNSFWTTATTTTTSATTTSTTVTTTTSTSTTTVSSTTSTTTTTRTTTATTTTVTTTTKLLDINERCDPRNDQCKKCHGLTSFNDTCNPDYDLKCDRESNNECRYANANSTKSTSSVTVTEGAYDWLSVLRTALPLLSVAIAAGVLAYKLRNAEDKTQACLQFFRCVDKEAPPQIDDEIVDRLEVIINTVTLSSSGGGDSSPAVPRTATLEKYRRRLSMYYSNDGVLGADEMDALKDEFGKEGITVIEHDTLLAEIIGSKEIVSSSSDEELASNDSDGGVDAAVSSSSDDDEMDF